MIIPSPSSDDDEYGLADLFDEAGMADHTGPGAAKCPSCSAEMMRGAIICIECGFNVQLGRHVDGAGPTKVRGKKTESEKMLDKAEQSLKLAPDESELLFGDDSSSYMLFMGMIVVAAIVLGGGLALAIVLGNVVGTEEGQLHPFWLTMIMAGFLWFVGKVWLTIAGFMENSQQGLIAAICAGAYGMSRMGTHAIAVGMWAIGSFMMGICGALYWFGAVKLD